MKKRICISVIGLTVSLLGAWVSAEDAFPVTITDALGNEITMEKAPEAIVSLSPASTEIIYSVGAGDKLVGRTDFCNYPEEAGAIDSIGSYTEPNMELILSKSPDLVLASDYIDDAIRTQLEDAGAVVCLLSANDLTAIENDINTVGKLAGCAEQAEKVVADMEAELADLTGKLEAVDAAKSAFVDLGSFYSAGPGSLLDNTMNIIGLENICADADSMWPMLSVESLIEKSPDVYISLYQPLDEIKQIAGMEALECLNAEDGFIYIDGMSPEGDMLQRPGPRYVEGVKVLAEKVYPEAFTE